MQTVKNILGSIWAIWAVIFFVTTLIIVFPIYFCCFLFGKKGEKVAFTVSKVWAFLLLCAFLIRLKNKGNEYYSPQGVYVMVCNHRSQLDIPITAVSVPFHFKFLAKEELVKFPLLGYVIKKLYLTVNRQSREGRAKSLLRMKATLGEDISVGIFPEGTRNKGPELLKSFHDGAFRLAVETGTPLAPLAIIGSAEVFHPKRKLYLMPGTIHCIWHPPVDTSNIQVSQTSELKEKVWNDIHHNLLKYLPEGKYPCKINS